MKLHEPLRNVNKKACLDYMHSHKHTEVKTLFECKKEHYIMIYF